MSVTSEGPVEVNVTIAGHSRIDFDKKAVPRVRHFTPHFCQIQGVAVI